ncbi:CDGSH iron-sulfur domain-containing protein 2 [Microtus ochrogaster]|uniref:CDGSH iron-sulfur domain-containing protein 2 n=1 Tax=Microtus ochrogaster TaxID=79684 RepID=A0A8J6FXP8_MICOH|nr:CDGSH iron-sulfur domain-containing protein 2 [Microtus ochrogaster]
MVLDSVARIVKVQLPAYLKQLPVPDSITGFARLTGGALRAGEKRGLNAKRVRCFHKRDPK